MSSAAPPESAGLPARRATPREWVGLAIIALPCMVYAMDLTVLNLAIPAISAQFRPSAAELLWIIDVYGFMVAGFLVTMGTLGDRVGRRRLLLIGAAAFAAASALAATADSAGMLIATRALLGVAGATLAPSTMSLIRNMFHDPPQRQFAIGVWIASFSFGAVIGPLVGGLLIEWAAWPAVFLVAIPVMLLLLVLGPFLLPEYRDPTAGRVDPASVALSLGAVLPTIYGLKQLAEAGPSLPALGALLLGLALGRAFIGRQRQIPYPLVDPSLFRRPAFSASISAYALSCLAMMGVYLFVTQYLQLVLGLSPIQAGLATVPSSLVFIVGSLAAPRLARHRPPATVLVGGLAFAAVGLVMQGIAAVAGGLPLLVAGMVIMSLGMAPVFTLGNELIITSAPPERAGAASAISETSSEFSSALGIALFGSLGTALYRARLATELPVLLAAEGLPGLPAPALNAVMASIGGAISVAGELAGGPAAALAAPLADIAREAFRLAMLVAALVAGLVAALAGLWAGRILRRPPPPLAGGGQQ